MRRLLTVLLALASCCHAVAAEAVAPSREISYDIYFHLRRGNCAMAVRLVNEQLRKPDAEILLFAGAMYENGTCVKRDWNRAVSYYVQSAQMGSRAGGMRLAAGYFDPLNGVDIASALWWAHQASAPLPEPCRVQGFGPAMEPDGFVAVLRTWPTTQAQGCAYVAAVTGGTFADPYYPGAAVMAQEDGRVQVRYVPGEGRFVGQLLAARGGALVQERRWKIGDPADGNTDLLSYVHDVSLQAARRYRDVPAIDPSWVVQFELVFRLVSQ